VASLAVADLFVACLVMPLGAVYEVSRRCPEKPKQRCGIYLKVLH